LHKLFKKRVTAEFHFDACISIYTVEMPQPPMSVGFVPGGKGEG
jgi:hypothetical protein